MTNVTFANLLKSQLWACDLQSSGGYGNMKTQTRIAKPIMPGVDYIISLDADDPDIEITPLEGEFYNDDQESQVYRVRKWGYLYLAAEHTTPDSLNDWKNYCKGQRSKTKIWLGD